MLRTSLFLLSLIAAVPAVAQERGGIMMRDPLATLDKIESNRGCPLSSTSVTVGVNKSFGIGSIARQQLNTMTSNGGSGCQPLFSTQVVTGANLALGRGSTAGQTIAAQGPRGVLGTDVFTRGANVGFGASSSASQRLFNQLGH